MFKKVLEYAGEYRKLTYASIIVVMLGVAASVLPFLFAWQIITPLLGYGEMDVSYVCLRILAIGVCGILYALLYVKGLQMSHRAAYHILKNIRASLQKKMESQPLGTIQEKGVLMISSPSSFCSPMRCRRVSPTWRFQCSYLSPCFLRTGSWRF